MNGFFRGLLGAIALLFALLFTLYLTTPSAKAQTTPYIVKPVCLPALSPTSLTASPPFLAYNSIGVCVSWLCYLPEFTPSNQTGVSQTTYCGTWAIQHLVGSRIQTIQKSADPLKSLQDAGKRFVILPLTDPSLAGLPIKEAQNPFPP